MRVRRFGVPRFDRFANCAEGFCYEVQAQIPKLYSTGLRRAQVVGARRAVRASAIVDNRFKLIVDGESASIQTRWGAAYVLS